MMAALVVVLVVLVEVFAQIRLLYMGLTQLVHTKIVGQMVLDIIILSGMVDVLLQI